MLAALDAAADASADAATAETTDADATADAIAPSPACHLQNGAICPAPRLTGQSSLM